MKHQQYPVKNQPNSVKHQHKSRLRFNTESTINSYATKREKKKIPKQPEAMTKTIRRQIRKKEIASKISTKRNG